MLQIDFLLELLIKCRENGIHTAIDTAGNIPFEYFERILPYTDLFLYDVKLIDNDKHGQYTGASNKLILDNLKKLLFLDASVWVRIPIISGVNDSFEEMKAIRSIFDDVGHPKKVELLPYHSMGENKYEALSMNKHSFCVPSEETMKSLMSVFE